MSAMELLEVLKTGGSGVLPLAVACLWWLHKDRERLIKALKERDAELREERTRGREDAIMYAKAVAQMRAEFSVPASTLRN